MIDIVMYKWSRQYQIDNQKFSFFSNMFSKLLVSPNPQIIKPGNQPNANKLFIIAETSQDY